MPTVPCSPDARPGRGGPLGELAPAALLRAVGDVRLLLGFRAAGLTRTQRRRVRLAGLVVVLLTVLAATVPAHVERSDAGNVLALLPSSALVFLVLAVVTSVASAGGREVVPREEAVALPVSTAADHLGALVLAPLNVAWVLQAWLLLGATAYGVGPAPVAARVAALLPVVLWLVVATALAQVAGWLVEGVRRGPRGALHFGLGLVAVLGVGVGVSVSGATTTVLDHSPTGVVLDAVLLGAGRSWLAWTGHVLVLALLAAAAVVVGTVPARWALRRPMRAEQGAEAAARTPRRTPVTDLGAALRMDRASVWRSVPLRRGVVVLALVPGLVALAGAVPWEVAPVLPALVAAGGALLFGVNAWCLDARGALWRESLPVRPRTVALARAWVLLELLLGSGAVTVLLVAVGAGAPRAPELVAVLVALVVVAVQVVAAAMRWSLARPYAVDLRSARATPAPPVVMVGYSARLAVSTTVTSMLLGALGQLPSVVPALVVGLVALLWSAWRLERTVLTWDDPVQRSRVVASVTG